MADDQRAPQWGDAPAGVTQQELLATAIAAFVIGCLVGWALFGKPAQLQAILTAGSLAEWFAAIATLIVGVGAWRYARAQLFQALDRSDEERQKDLSDSLAETAAIRSAALQCHNAEGAAMSLRDVDVVFSGIYRRQMSIARDAIEQIKWPDARVLTFHPSAAKIYEELIFRAQNFVRLTDVVMRAFEADSQEPISELQIRQFNVFADFAAELSATTSRLSALLTESEIALASRITDLASRRARRSHTFDFEP